VLKRLSKKVMSSQKSATIPTRHGVSSGRRKGALRCEDCGSMSFDVDDKLGILTCRVCNKTSDAIEYTAHDWDAKVNLSTAVSEMQEDFEVGEASKVKHPMHRLNAELLLEGMCTICRVQAKAMVERLHFPVRYYDMVGKITFGLFKTWIDKGWGKNGKAQVWTNGTWKWKQNAEPFYRYPPRLVYEYKNKIGRFRPGTEKVKEAKISVMETLRRREMSKKKAKALSQFRTAKYRRRARKHTHKNIRIRKIRKKGKYDDERFLKKQILVKIPTTNIKPPTASKLVSKYEIRCGDINKSYYLAILWLAARMIRMPVEFRELLLWMRLGIIPSYDMTRYFDDTWHRTFKKVKHYIYRQKMLAFFSDTYLSQSPRILRQYAAGLVKGIGIPQWVNSDTLVSNPNAQVLRYLDGLNVPAILHALAMEVCHRFLNELRGWTEKKLFKDYLGRWPQRVLMMACVFVTIRIAYTTKREEGDEVNQLSGVPSLSSWLDVSSLYRWKVPINLRASFHNADPFYEEIADTVYLMSYGASSTGSNTKVVEKLRKESNIERPTDILDKVIPLELPATVDLRQLLEKIPPIHVSSPTNTPHFSIPNGKMFHSEYESVLSLCAARIGCQTPELHLASDFVLDMVLKVFKPTKVPKQRLSFKSKSKKVVRKVSKASKAVKRRKKKVKSSQRSPKKVKPVSQRGRPRTRSQSLSRAKSKSLQPSEKLLKRSVSQKKSVSPTEPIAKRTRSRSKSLSLPHLLPAKKRSRSRSVSLPSPNTPSQSLVVEEPNVSPGNGVQKNVVEKKKHGEGLLAPEFDDGSLCLSAPDEDVDSIENTELPIKMEEKRKPELHDEVKDNGISEKPTRNSDIIYDGGRMSDVSQERSPSLLI